VNCGEVAKPWASVTAWADRAPTANEALVLIHQHN
jgi:hypothetical protein